MAKSTKKTSSKAAKNTKSKKTKAAKTTTKNVKTQKTSLKEKRASKKDSQQITQKPKDKKLKSTKVELEGKEIPTVSIPKKPAYSKKDLEYFKKIILEKREEIIQQLEMLRERMIEDTDGTYVNENSPYSLHMAEQGTDAMEKEKNYLWAQRETKFLSYLDAALERIENGTYGYCIDCGAVIEKGRLEAVPHTQHCMNCKTKFSK